MAFFLFIACFWSGVVCWIRDNTDEFFCVSISCFVIGGVLRVTIFTSVALVGHNETVIVYVVCAACREQVVKGVVTHLELIDTSERRQFTATITIAPRGTLGGLRDRSGGGGDGGRGQGR